MEFKEEFEKLINHYYFIEKCCDTCDRRNASMHSADFCSGLTSDSCINYNYSKWKPIYVKENKPPCCETCENYEYKFKKIKEDKPPLGLKPKKIVDEERFQELSEAIERYKNVNKNVPKEWKSEFIDLLMKKMYDYDKE